MKQRLLSLLIPTLTGIVLTTILTWPFLLKLTSFYSDFGDYPTNGFFLWYNQLSIATGRILNPSLYFNSFQFYPFPYSVAFNEFLFIPSLIFSPIFWITGQLPFSLNLYIFLTLIFSFISSFFSINYFIKNKFACLIGATVYTFNPMTFAHFPNHVNLMGKYFLPPLLAFGYLFFQIPTTKRALFFFLFLTLNALTSFHYMFFSSFALVIYFLTFSLFNLYKKNFVYFWEVLKKSLFLVIFIPVLAFFYLPYLDFAQKEGATYNFQNLQFYSATLEDWLSPLPNNLFYGQLFKNNRPQKIPAGYANINEEHTLFTNVLPLTLAILSLFFLLKSALGQDRKESKDRLLLSISFITLMMTAILAFGPILSFKINQSSNIKLPFYYLMQWLPIFNATRVPSRFQFIFYIPFSLLVAYGSTIILRTGKRYLLPLFILLPSFLILENLNNFSFDATSSVLKEKDYIEHQFGFLNDKGTLHYPPGQVGDTARYLNFVTLTKEKMINGYSGYMPQDWFSFMADYQISLGENNLKKLEAIDIQYIIIHKDILSKEQTQKLSQDQIFFQKGIVFDTDKIQVVDLVKLGFNIKRCDFDRDFDLVLSRIPLGDTYFYSLSIENQEDCYLANTFQNRYRNKVVFEKGVEIKVFIRMPIIISPYEKVNVDELNKNLTIMQ